jgi:hypothetical protein
MSPAFALRPAAFAPEAFVTFLILGIGQFS